MTADDIKQWFVDYDAAVIIYGTTLFGVENGRNVIAVLYCREPSRQRGTHPFQARFIGWRSCERKLPFSLSREGLSCRSSFGPSGFAAAR